MSGRAFSIVAAVGVALATVCLALAAVIGSGVLAVAGVLFLVAVFVAREGWLWRGDLSGWLSTMVGLGAVVAIAFAVETVDAHCFETHEAG